MEKIKISDFLKEYDGKRSGTCKLCEKTVQWCQRSLYSHKRSSCVAASDQEKRRFSKRPNNFSFDSSDGNRNSEADGINATCANCNFSEELGEELSLKMGEFFYRTGISFRLADSAIFKEFVTCLNPSFAQVMPSAKSLAGSLLDKQYTNNSKKLREILAESKSLTLVSNGSTNVRGDHIVNFCIKAPERKLFFYSSINTSETTQNAQDVADPIIKVIEELGAEKFIQVVTDNAPVMRAAWEIIERRFPHISANGCAAHAMNLLLKDLLNTTENLQTCKESESIIKFILNHNIVREHYEVKRKAATIQHTLSVPVETCWFSRYSSLNDLLSSEYVLIQLVDEKSQDLRNIQPKSTSAAVLKLIKSKEFWERLGKVVKLIEYPANIFGKFQTDDPAISLVYHYFGELYNHFRDNAVAQAKVRARLKFVYTNIMGLAYMLTPKYAAEGFYFDEEEQTEGIGYDQTFFIGFAEKLAERTNPEDAAKVGAEMLSFTTKMATLPESQRETVFRMSAKNYWVVIGRRQFPNLFKTIEPILEMICSSASSEKTWSTFKLNHSRLRNRLTNERVEKLAFVNCSALDEKDPNDYILEAGAVLQGSDCEEYEEINFEIKEEIV